MTAPPKVLICVPSNRAIPAEVAESLAHLYGHGRMYGYVSGLAIHADTYIDAARNQLVTEALKQKDVTHLFWFDDDMIIPADTIPWMLSRCLPVVGGLYHQRTPPFHPVAYLNVGDPAGSVRFITLPDDPTGLYRVDGMGLGCCLVDIDVYRQIPDRHWHRVSDGRGEDLWFFDRCAELGVPVWLDTNVRAGHVRRETVGTVHYQSFRQATAMRRTVGECEGCGDPETVTVDGLCDDCSRWVSDHPTG